MVSNGRRKNSETELTDSPKTVSQEEIQDIIQTGDRFRKFSSEPSIQKTSVCFDTDADFTHKQVLAVITSKIDENLVISIKFENVQAITQNANKQNRWIIQCKDNIARNKLVNSEFSVLGEKLRIRILDMAVMEDYKLFLRTTKQTDKLQKLVLSSGFTNSALCL